MQVSVPTITPSKKFGAAALAAVLSGVGIKFGFAIEQIAIVTAPLYAYIGSQGLADIGKEREKVARTMDNASHQ